MIDKIEIADLSFLREIPEDVWVLREELAASKATNKILKKKNLTQRNKNLLLFGVLTIMTIYLIRKSNNNKKKLR